MHALKNIHNMHTFPERDFVKKLFSDSDMLKAVQEKDTQQFLFLSFKAGEESELIMLTHATFFCVFFVPLFPHLTKEKKKRKGKGSNLHTEKETKQPVVLRVYLTLRSKKGGGNKALFPS